MKLNTIYNTDSIEYMKGLKDECIDLIITDPPYKITRRGNTGTSGGMFKGELSMKGKIFKNNDITPKDYIPELYRILKSGSHCYIMTNHVNLQEILNTATNCGFHFIKSLIWNKGNKIMSQYYMNQFEYILFFRKGKAKRINHCGTSDILDIPNKKIKDENGKNLHDTEKPIDLMKILVNNSSNERDIVLDPFCGIGSTVIASKILNRQYIGVEIDTKYFNITKDRLENNL